MFTPGGTDGGGGKFLLGLLLSAVSLYFFFDSVIIGTQGGGLVSGMMRGGRGSSGGRGMWETTSMGIIFLPFVIGLIALFYDVKLRWAWVVTWVGLAIIVIEFLSRIRPQMEIKASHLLIMFVTFAAGAGLMLQSYRDQRLGRSGGKQDDEGPAADRQSEK